MVDYPLRFETESFAQKGDKTWVSATGDKEIELTVPEEFGGEEGTPSPESLYCMSVENCLLATFKTIAERQDVEFDRIESRSEAVLSRDSEGRPEIKEADVNITVYGIEDEKAEEIREMTLKNCFIHRSVKTEIKTEFEFK